ncbi:hypothetical protein HELA111659_05495 [Helicobacter labetoulli]
MKWNLTIFAKKEYTRPSSIDNALLASCLKYDNLISYMQTYHPLGSLYGAFLAKYDKNLADSTFAHSTDEILPFAESDKWSEEQAKQVCQRMRESTQSKGHFITLETLYDLEKLNTNFLKQKQETMAIFSKLCENKDELNSLFAYPCQNLESVHYAILRTYLAAEGACQGGILLRHKAEYDKELKRDKSKATARMSRKDNVAVRIRIYLSLIIQSLD